MMNYVLLFFSRFILYINDRPIRNIYGRTDELEGWLLRLERKEKKGRKSTNKNWEKKFFLSLNLYPIDRKQIRTKNKKKKENNHKEKQEANQQTQTEDSNQVGRSIC